MAGFVEVIWVWREAEYFWDGDWTGQISLKLQEKIADWRNAPRMSFRSRGRDRMRITASWDVTENLVGYITITDWGPERGQKSLDLVLGKR